MKVALTYAIPSPELETIADAARTDNELTMIPQWSVESHAVVYDLAVCVGPVSFCPLSRRRVLFALGMTRNQFPADWDTVVVTSEKARKAAFSRFGHRTRVLVLPPPLTGLHLAKRRLLDERRRLIHASEGGIPLRGDAETLVLWGDLGFDRREPESLDFPSPAPTEIFSLLEFNSRVKAGAIGFYPDCMDDGYDVQVRRHLSLGGPVVCRRDKDVLGPLADLCLDRLSGAVSMNENSLDCAGNAVEYKSRVEALLKKS